MAGDVALDRETAASFARLALSHIRREYPNKLDHVLASANDLRSPQELHPVFFGSFDWHSCVHGYWLLATIARLYPDLAEADETRKLFDAQLTQAKVQVEVDYSSDALHGTFERPYGWAWLLMLSAELGRHSNDEARRWRDTLKPLTVAFVARFNAFLPKATYPTRVGTHFNSAFALSLALEYADEADAALGRKLREKAIVWFGADESCQAWEPGGDDFLSPALMEAECMRRVLGEKEFPAWLDRFLPRLSGREPATLFQPATVTDRSDGKIAHLDGLNLSRAWCWRSMSRAWGERDARRGIALDAARIHLTASLPHVAGDYMGEHWLATFALLALLS
jgi:hypothetical protein